MLAPAVEAFPAEHSGLRDSAGRHSVIRNGHLTDREIQTGIGWIPVKAARVRNHTTLGLRFTSNILPRYLRRTRSIAALLPWLYLRGISTGTFARPLPHCWGRMHRGFRQL